MGFTPDSDSTRDSSDVNSTSPSEVVPQPPESARARFGAHYSEAVRYYQWLAGAARERGLMGPREVDRLWDRHILNCAAAAEQIEHGAVVVDIGSGAGLPGIPLALCRPDLTVTLVEPLLRRAAFLQEVVDDLHLDVQVVRGRAEDGNVIRTVGGADVVTSRAVAPLGKLAGWSVPLLTSGGRMVALKGDSAQEELDRDREILRKLRLTDSKVVCVHVPDAERTHLIISTLADKMT